MASYRLKPTLGTAPLMSALGQKQTSGHVQSMSALPPKADITECDRHVRFVRKADSCAAAKASLYTLLIGPVAGKPSGALYQHQGPRQPATSYNRQCRLWLNTPLPPRTRLQNHIEPQQTGGNYEDTGLKIMIDPLASGSPSFDQPTCQIEAESNNKGCYCDRCCDAYQRNDFTERDARHQERENNCGKRNGTGLPTNYDCNAHCPF